LSHGVHTPLEGVCIKATSGGVNLGQGVYTSLGGSAYNCDSNHLISTFIRKLKKRNHENNNDAINFIEVVWLLNKGNVRLFDIVMSRGVTYASEVDAVLLHIK